MSSTEQRRSPKLKGDEAELFERYAKRLHRSVRRAVSLPVGLIEDACSFAWLQLVRTQPERERVFAWLRVVAINEACRLAKVGARSGSLDSPDNHGEAVGLGIVDEVWERLGVEARAELRAVLDEVAQMPERRRRIFLLHLSGATYAEIAARTGENHAAIDRQIVKARTALRRRLR